MGNLFNKKLINLNLKANTKKDAIKELASLIDSEDRLNNYDKYVDSVLKREKLSTTGIGFHIGIPHGKCKDVKKTTIAFGRRKEGINWDSLDDKPVKIIFLLAVAEKFASNEHLKILSSLSKKLLDKEFREKLLNLESEDEILNLLTNVFNKALNK
ncbi:MAG: PTS sugar transporter subunit IIA [Firmicutes bacterium]|nr:PTS sugar transporter subunit IIA [Bacillota bacterium]